MRLLSRLCFNLKWYKLSRTFSKQEYARLMINKINTTLEKMADVFQKMADTYQDYKSKLGGDENEENETAKGNE